MKALFDTALAGLRWGWERLVPLAKAGWAKLRALFDTVIDPSPRTIRFYFWSVFALVACVWVTFAFVNSWFYRPAMQALADFSYVLGGDDLDVVLPELEPTAPVAVELPEVAGVEIVCHDMSDTPHCEPVPYSKLDKEPEPEPIVEEAIQTPPVAKPKATVKKRLTVRRKPQPYVTYWGF